METFFPSLSTKYHDSCLKLSLSPKNKIFGYLILLNAFAFKNKFIQFKVKLGKIVVHYKSSFTKSLKPLLNRTIR